MKVSLKIDLKKNQQTKPKPGVLIITQESLRALLFNINN